MKTSLRFLVVSILFHAFAGPSIASEETYRTLYLIRHGHYDLEDERDPEVGRALVPIGVAQARLLAHRLATLPVEMSSLHSSTLTRARQTAAIVGEEFPKLSLEKTPLLSECTPTTWREDIMAQLEPGEAEECEEQLEAAFAKFFVPARGGDRHDIVVCHGNVIRYFVTKVLRVDPDAWLGMSIANCSVTTVRIASDGAMKLLAFADVGHVPPNLQTGLARPKRDLSIPGEETKEETMTAPLGFEVDLAHPYDEAIERVTEALKAEGFGILTRIDVQATLKEKLGEDFRPYVILGACNPPIAHRALSRDARVGLMMPCNVTVEQTENGSLVRIGNPDLFLTLGGLGGDPEIRAVADDVRERLARVVSSLEGVAQSN